MSIAVSRAPRLLQAAIAVAVLSVVVRWIGAPIARAYFTSKLVVAEPTWNIDAFVGDSLQHEFVIRNAGPLRTSVTGVHPTCGCTTIGKELVGQELKPGEFIKVPVFMDSGAPMEINQAVYVTFKSGSPSSIRLACEGQVRNRWIAEPTTVELQEIDERQVVRLKLVDGATLVPLNGISVNHRAIVADFKPDSSSTQGYREIEITHRSEFDDFRHADVQIFLSSDASHVITINVKLPGRS